MPAELSAEAIIAMSPHPVLDNPGENNKKNNNSNNIATTTASMTPPASADGEKISSSSSVDHNNTSPSSASSSTSELSDMELDSNSNCNSNLNTGANSNTATVPESTTTTTTAADEIHPDHYYGGGKIPVFKPTMDQFRDFSAFVQKVDSYGMKSGVIKIIPPKEWTDALPSLEESVKTIRVKNPIMQEFHGSHGTFTQANIEKQRSYNLPQWKSLCEESSHQPPARRGERRRNQEKVNRGATNKAQSRSNSQRRKPGPKPKRVEVDKPMEESSENHVDKSKPESPPTPVSPESKPVETRTEILSDGESLPAPKPKGRQPKSVSARRKYNRGDAADYVDEEAFQDFDYRLSGTEEFTPERCEELETAYWKSLMYNNPMYGADMPGSLFDDSVTSWNVAKLPNLLDVLGQKVPGVNTAYLYLGMWKATFAWHLEDVDLYSINYIHFGAPKQWYSISQEDMGKFEAAMKSVWPSDAKNCDQFLRHKTYLISPSLLKSQFGISVNKMVHYEGEFVITYPYGYHSGFNLGYNCAESVNFATESWLDYARVAKKCHCEADSVWIDIGEIERKLRGESTPEYYDEMGSDQDEMDMDGVSDLLTPPRSVPEKSGTRVRKRKREAQESKAKRAKLHVTGPKKIRCVLCPNSMDYEELLATEDGKSHAHRRCATYIEETTILRDDSGTEVVCDVDKVPKARLGLKCLFCREINGACFQCMHGKCTRAYHPTCALLAGVQVEYGAVAVMADDGLEYSVPGVDLKCKYHRPKKYAYMQGETLDLDPKLTQVARNIQAGELVQFQADKEINGAVVLENRPVERSVLVKVLPRGDVMELPYRFLLIVKKSSFPPLPAGIKPLPSHLARKPDAKKDLTSSLPSPGTPFGDARFVYQWGEFISAKPPFNSSSTKVDLSKPEQIWYYLGKSSTECRAQYTENPDKLSHNPRSNFLESVKSLNAPVATTHHHPSYARNYPSSPFTRHPTAPQRPTVTSVSVSQPTQTATAKPQPVKSPTVATTTTTAAAAATASTTTNTTANIAHNLIKSQPVKSSQFISQSPTSHPTNSQLPIEKLQPPEPHNNNHKMSVWAGDITSQFTMARRLVASITDHANLRAGYTIVNSDFVVQTLLGQAGSVLPKNGMEKLKTAMSESMVKPKGSNQNINNNNTNNNDADYAPLQPLNMKADEVDHLLRMLRFALMNLTPKGTTVAEKKPPEEKALQEVPVNEPCGPRPKFEGKYAYLDMQRHQSATVYQSPYAPGFGFSDYARREYNLIGEVFAEPKPSLAIQYFDGLSREDKEKVIEACGVDVTVPRRKIRMQVPTVEEHLALDTGPGNHNNHHVGVLGVGVSRFGQQPSSLSSTSSFPVPSSLDAMTLDDPHHHLHGLHNHAQNHNHLSVFDMHMSMTMPLPATADSPASASGCSTFGRPPLRYQSPHDFSLHIEHESSILPRHLQLHDHDLFGDQQANQRFWQRSVGPWVDGDCGNSDAGGGGKLPVDGRERDDEHRPFFGPHERPAGFGSAGNDYASSDLDMGRGPGSLHSMDMAGFGFDGPDEGGSP
ncbi:jumonji family transcription factor [Blastomyces gilchristii SLH14081]|uniref:[histone H3]-trimethyl-L-lysine(9) demethylase n=1 Tax=Blastomyces gilchristii (strain SLH14081) TaxID=559298 RepID=A0A179UHP0_BLAGS|nr:jumonji family transcription factor [Blastomyces gilchristii SLH14081]OAT07514.1 jumonji family transcription factor [Blastomyces gilchristii SLH14081]